MSWLGSYPSSFSIRAATAHLPMQQQSRYSSLQLVASTLNILNRLYSRIQMHVPLFDTNLLKIIYPFPFTSHSIIAASHIHIKFKLNILKFVV